MAACPRPSGAVHGEAPVTEAIVARGAGGACRISAMSPSDIDEVIGFLGRFPEVCVRPWEDRGLMQSVLANRHNVCCVARTAPGAGGAVVGALIGGAMGARATVNHLAVDPAYRRLGLGRELVGHALQAFRSQGICRVFLFIVEQAAEAHGFWAALGFKPVRHELTCELDLAPPACARAAAPRT